MPKKKKQRLDTLLYESGLADTLAKAQGMIMAGEVRVNDHAVYSAGIQFTADAKIQLKVRSPYVSRGGEKLAGALKDFDFDPDGLICADTGASTGGFTDCLLQHGAARIYAIDVGYGHLAHKLRNDNRVIVMERTNARYIEALAEPVNLVVVDASFISLKLLLPPIKKWLSVPGDVIALIKPQFEAYKSEVSPGGIVDNDEVHRRILEMIITFAAQTGFTLAGLTISPIKGQKSENTEFLIWLQSGYQNPPLDTESSIRTVLSHD
ncbi:MAG: TlyA family RNA methyltransferase [Aggregatilineales bacterium]